MRLTTQQKQVFATAGFCWLAITVMVFLIRLPWWSSLLALLLLAGFAFAWAAAVAPSRGAKSGLSRQAALRFAVVAAVLLLVCGGVLLLMSLL